MTLKFFAMYRDVTRCKDEVVAAPADVWALLISLDERYKGFGKKLFSPDGADISENAIVLVNGRNIHFLNGKHTPLCDKDTVSLFPVVAGG